MPKLDLGKDQTRKIVAVCHHHPAIYASLPLDLKETDYVIQHINKESNTSSTERAPIVTKAGRQQINEVEEALFEKSFLPEDQSAQDAYRLLLATIVTHAGYVDSEDAGTIIVGWRSGYATEIDLTESTPTVIEWSGAMCSSPADMVDERTGTDTRGLCVRLATYETMEGHPACASHAGSGSSARKYGS